MCFFNPSAAGCIVSRLCNDIVTSDTFVGAVHPVDGRTSTLPSTLGFAHLSALSHALVSRTRQTY